MHSYSKSSNYIRNILERNLYLNNYLNLSGWNNIDLGLTLNTDLNIHLENKVQKFPHEKVKTCQIFKI